MLAFDRCWGYPWFVRIEAVPCGLLPLVLADGRGFCITSGRFVNLE